MRQKGVYGPAQPSRKNKWPFAGDFALFSEISGVNLVFLTIIPSGSGDRAPTLKNSDVITLTF